MMCQGQTLCVHTWRLLFFLFLLILFGFDERFTFNRKILLYSVKIYSRCYADITTKLQTTVTRHLEKTVCALVIALQTTIIPLSKRLNQEFIRTFLSLTKRCKILPSNNYVHLLRVCRSHQHTAKRFIELREKGNKKVTSLINLTT